MPPTPTPEGIAGLGCGLVVILGVNVIAAVWGAAVGADSKSRSAAIGCGLTAGVAAFVVVATIATVGGNNLISPKSSVMPVYSRGEIAWIIGSCALLLLLPPVTCFVVARKIKKAKSSRSVSQQRRLRTDRCFEESRDAPSTRKSRRKK
jgi:hypothetical protein